MRISTLFRHWKLTLLGITLTALTVAAPFLFPELFDFVAPSPLIWVLISAMLLLSVLQLLLFNRNRHLINRLWKLVEP